MPARSKGAVVLVGVAVAIVGCLVLDVAWMAAVLVRPR